MVAAASKGIGLAIARALAAEGAHVSICARDEARLEAAAAEIGGETRSYVVDVTDAEDLRWWHEQTVADLGTPQILVTNTGGPPAGGPLDHDDAAWRTGMDSTLLNVTRLVALVEPGMAIRKWGRIVHVSSLVAQEPSPMLAISSTLRAGLVALTKLQARELAPRGITVNGLLPGHTLTDRQRHLADLRADRDGIDPEEALRLQGEETPIGRLAEPQEIAAVAAFLCGRGAAYLTGQSIVVDGGANRGI